MNKISRLILIVTLFSQSINAAMFFPDNGNVANVLTGNVTTTPSTTDATFTSWIYMTDNSVPYQAIVESRTSTFTGLLISGDHTDSAYDQLTFAWNNQANEYNAASGLYVRLNKWYFAAGSISSGNTIVYLIDQSGIIQTFTISNTPVSNPISGQFTVGADFNAGVFLRNWPGKLDDVRVYSRALSRAEMLTLGLSQERIHITDGLVAEWGLDNSSSYGLSSVGTNNITDYSINKTPLSGQVSGDMTWTSGILNYLGGNQ